MGEDTCKWCNRQGLNFQIIETAHTTKQHKNNSKKIEKGAEDLNEHFSKEDIQMVKNHVERCSATLVIRVMQIKTVMKHLLTAVRMSTMNKCTNNTSARGSMEKRQLSCTAGANVSWCSHYWEQYRGSSKH